MSQQGGTPTGHEDDWWGQLYDDSTEDTGPARTADSLDDRFASAAGAVRSADAAESVGTGAAAASHLEGGGDAADAPGAAGPVPAPRAEPGGRPDWWTSPTATAAGTTTSAEATVPPPRSRSTAESAPGRDIGRLGGPDFEQAGSSDSAGVGSGAGAGPRDGPARGDDGRDVRGDTGRGAGHDGERGVGLGAERDGERGPRRDTVRGTGRDGVGGSPLRDAAGAGAGVGAGGVEAGPGVRPPGRHRAPWEPPSVTPAGPTNFPPGPLPQGFAQRQSRGSASATDGLTSTGALPGASEPPTPSVPPAPPPLPATSPAGPATSPTGPATSPTGPATSPAGAATSPTGPATSPSGPGSATGTGSATGPDAVPPVPSVPPAPPAMPPVPAHAPSPPMAPTTSVDGTTASLGATNPAPAPSRGPASDPTPVADRAPGSQHAPGAPVSPSTPVPVPPSTSAPLPVSPPDHPPTLPGISALPVLPDLPPLPVSKDYVGSGPPTYDAEPTALPPADPDDLDDLVPDTVLDGARYGAFALRAASVRGDSARYRGEPRRDSLLTARFGVGEHALILVAMATGARATPGAHRAAAEVCQWIGRAVGRSHVRLAEDIRAARRGDLKSGLHRLTDRSLGRLRAGAAEQGLEPDEYAATLRCLLLPADPACRTRVFFGVGAGGLLRLRGGVWRDIEPQVGDVAGEPVVGFGSLPAETPEGDRLTMDLGITTPPNPYDPDPGPPREPFRFRASVARPGDTLLMCTSGLAEPLRGEPGLSAHLAERWSDPTPPGLAAFLADTQVRVKGYADDRTAAAVWEA
ncbi:protein phosphatase 2C domain-containing protein [Streptomyces sp. NPDC005486]|uniref:protein phosphatase 2C domain-containing protein n=1 Tax=Streptomyces sp. NPDC005486 TaxID=3155345 RepID=UPI0033BF22EB